MKIALSSICVLLILGFASAYPSSYSPSSSSTGLDWLDKFMNKLKKFKENKNWGGSYGSSASGRMSWGSSSGAQKKPKFEFKLAKWNRTSGEATLKQWGNDGEKYTFDISESALKELENATYEEPAFEVVPEQPESGDFQVRKYAPANWVCTNVKAESAQMASTMGFRFLFSYINGENEKGQKIKMTIPVLTVKNEAANCQFCLPNFMTCFYLDEKAQADPPLPNSARVFLKKLSPTVLVKEYAEMFLNENTGELGELIDAVNSDGTYQPLKLSNTDEYMYGFASYTDPTKSDKPRSEVWLVMS